jgi:multimeric flavodoxin WrbA
MKVVVITGSPHKKGTSACLADNFIKGATEAGHEVYRFDAAFKKVRPCLGCKACITKGEGCVLKDDMEELNPKLLEADAVVFASPIFYCNLSAQIKTVIDRFFANDRAICGKRKTALLTTMKDKTMRSAEGVNICFRNTAIWLDWEVAGIVNAMEYLSVEVLEKTDYPQKAYELGKNL